MTDQHEPRRARRPRAPRRRARQPSQRPRPRVRGEGRARGRTCGTSTAAATSTTCSARARCCWATRIPPWSTRCSASSPTARPSCSSTSRSSSWPRRSCGRCPAPSRCASCRAAREATFFALRVARAFRQRDKIMKFEGGFHGTHDYALMSVSPRSPKAFPAAMADSARHPARHRRGCPDRAVQRPRHHRGADRRPPQRAGGGDRRALPARDRARSPGS